MSFGFDSFEGLRQMIIMTLNISEDPLKKKQKEI